MNLIKLCVGITSVDELIEFRDMQQAAGHIASDGLHRHHTRMFPKRAKDIVGQGSIYWVMSGAVRCRQLIVSLDQLKDEEGKSYCSIVLAPEIIRTVPYPRRPFQGWRYLENSDCPPDLANGSDELPPEGMAEELARLGLL